MYSGMQVRSLVIGRLLHNKPTTAMHKQREFRRATVCFITV